MAKLEMQRFQLVALHKDRKAILEFLQRKGAVEIKNIEPVGEMYKLDTSKSIAQFEKNGIVAKQALAILNEIVPEKKSLLDSFNGRKVITEAQYKSMASDSELTMKKCHDIVSCSKAITDNATQIQRLNVLMDGLKPWLDLDIPMRYKGSSSTRAFVGYFPEELGEDEIKSQIAQKSPELTEYELEIVNSANNQTCVVFICHKSAADELEQTLRAMSFTRPSEPTKHPPKVRMQRYLDEEEKLKKDIEKRREKIASYADSREDIKFEVDYFLMRTEKYEALNRLAISKHAFVLDGYVPKIISEKLSDELHKKFEVAIDVFDPAPDEEVPVKFKNNGFVEPVEPITEMFALPTRDEIDPNPVMSIFYYVLFGLMLSDAAYGILMILFTTFALKKFTLEPGMKKMMKMFFFCGISTTFWGAIFGSWFGDVVSVVSSTFFGKTVSLNPIWFSPLDNPMQMLIFSMIIGIIHIFVGLGCGFYTLWKNGKKLDAIYDVGFWYMLLGGIIVFGVGSILGFPSIVNTIGAVIALIGVLGIIIMTGRSSGNVFKRLAKGLYAVYNITGYLSDVLSYSRLLALGLATGVIASVINTMGAMVGDSIFGVIVFILVFIVGHTLNIAINVLGAYVHCNRLQFVEFFGKFYEGGGRAFSPLHAATQYFKFKEEKQ